MPSRLAAGLLLAALTCAGQLATGCGRNDPERSLREDGSPTWAEDIAPLVYRECVTCHRPGELAPFSLLTYDGARKRASQMAQVTSSRFMPPWKPEPGYGDFLDERRLTDDEIDLFRRWARADAPLGDSTRAPEPPTFPEGWQLGEPDLVLRMPEAYTVPAEGVDVFRNFVLRSSGGEGERPRYVEAFEFRPGNPRVVHHAVIMVDDSGVGRRRDALDDEPGFAGMSFGEAHEPEGHFLGWTPGKAPARNRADLAWSLPPRADMVVLLHMLPTGRPEPIQAAIGLHFADEPPRRVPATLRLGRKDLDIAPGDSAYVVQDDFVLPVAVDVLRIYPHMHYLGASVQVQAHHPDGTSQWLIRIDEWDFNWQDDYRYADPVPRLPAGTRLSMRYVFDNSAGNIFNPNIPPRRVTYGLRSSDEMADLTLQVLPVEPEGLTPLLQAARRQWLAQEIQGHRMLLRAEPDDGETQHTLAMYYLQAGRADSAFVHFDAAVRLAPDSPEVRVNYGLALMGAGRPAVALTQLRRAVELRPSYSEAHFNLGLALHATGETRRAQAHFAEAARLRPEMAAAIRRTVASLAR